MNWYDVIFISALILGGVLGALSGFIWQIANIIAIIISVYLSIIIHNPIALWLGAQSSNPFLAKVGVFLFVFICLYLILFFIIWFIERSVKKNNLKLFDRILGGILGCLKTALICGTILMGVVFYSVGRLQPPLKNSFLAPYLLDFTRRTVFIMPQSYQKQVKHFIELINEARNPTLSETKTQSPDKQK